MALAAIKPPRTAASEHFRAALEKDPSFTRAQAWLVRCQDSAEDQYNEYKKLEALNPNHPIVIWAGATIEASHDAGGEDAESGDG